MEHKHFFCVKCQAGKTVIGQTPVIFKNGSAALKGKCPSCDSAAYKIVKREQLAMHSAAPRAEKKENSSNLGLLVFVIFSAGLAVGALLANIT